jgi:cyclopropane fatty-acyl-phospholipid synthase-like methyltransferase
VVRPFLFVDIIDNMPTSHNTNIEYIARLIRDNAPQTILDVGAGAGKYGHLTRAIYLDSKIDAVEVWEPYIKKYKLKSLYDKVYQSDIREFNNLNYDLIILGDVIEHMSKEDAVSLMERVASQAQMAIISIPVCHCPQGHVHDNPYEEHVKDDWSHEEIMETFSNIFQYELFSETGTYFLDYRSYDS